MNEITVIGSVPVVVSSPDCVVFPSVAEPVIHDALSLDAVISASVMVTLAPEVVVPVARILSVLMMLKERRGRDGG